MSTKHHRYRRKKKTSSRTFEIITALVAVLLICCAYAGCINPESFFPAPFMQLAYVPMLAVVAFMLVIALVFRRWLVAIMLVVSFLATAPVFRHFMPFNSAEMAPPEPADRSLVLKVMTYNVLSFNYNEPELSAQPSLTMKLILDADPDVLLMQEGGARGLSWDQVPSLQPYVAEVKARYPYTHFGSEGLAIMSKFPFTTSTLGEPQYGRSPLGYNRSQMSYLARAYDLQLPSGKQLRLVDFRLQSYHLSFGKSHSVRVSPDVKPSALERMRRSFALRGSDAAVIRQAIDASPANLIVCGDMNDVPESHVYRLICGDDLQDVWEQVGSGYASTYNRHNLCYRIDHIFYRGDLRALRAQRIKGGSSDHYPIMATFDIDITDK